MPDVGSARADFPGGDARSLYRSMRRLLDLPSETRMFMCHDYPPGGRAPHWEITVAAQRAAGKRAPIIERGYDPVVRVAGTIASVWMPYDLWAQGKWSHCGIDLLTLVQVGRTWRIANFTYTIEQPPACTMHPDGPPPGYAPPPGR
jgi:hypothetical protein